MTFNPSLAFFAGVSCSDSSRVVFSFSTTALYASKSSSLSRAAMSSKTVSRDERFLFGEQESGVLNLDLVGVVGADMMDSEDLRLMAMLEERGMLTAVQSPANHYLPRAERGEAALSGSQSYKSGGSQSKLK